MLVHNFIEKAKIPGIPNQASVNANNQYYNITRHCRYGSSFETYTSNGLVFGFSDRRFVYNDQRIINKQGYSTKGIDEPSKFLLPQ